MLNTPLNDVVILRHPEAVRKLMSSFAFPINIPEEFLSKYEVFRSEKQKISGSAYLMPSEFKESSNLPSSTKECVSLSGIKLFLLSLWLWIFKLDNS